MTDSYKACIFLGELALNEDQIGLIKTSLPESHCQLYLLAKREGNAKNISNFINNFPNSEEQKEIWRIHSNSGYPIQFIPPYINFLAAIAITSDAALNKLTGTLNHTDDAHADAMIEVLAKLYIKHGDRVASSFDTNKTPINLINLIKETANYFGSIGENK